MPTIIDAHIAHAGEREITIITLDEWPEKCTSQDVFSIGHHAFTLHIVHVDGSPKRHLEPVFGINTTNIRYPATWYLGKVVRKISESELSQFPTVHKLGFQ